MTDGHIGATDEGPDAEALADEGDDHTPGGQAADPPDKEVELAVVTMRFDSTDDAALLGVLSKYIVLTRMVPGCRNVDLCSSVTVPGRHLVIQKWDDADAQQAHFDSDLMVEMARNCIGILSAPPDIDLWDATSAHDLA